MSNKQQKKQKIRAKQRSMEYAREEGGQSYARQTEGIDEAVRHKDDGSSDSKKTRAAVNAMLADAKAGADIDPRLVQLFKDFKLYRVLVVAIVVIGFLILLLAMYLYSIGQIGENTQNNIILFANVVIVLGMVIAFGRARPIREDINAWSKVNEIALQKSHGAHGATQADIDKIFLSRARNKRVPPIPEYRRLRRVWLALLVGASLFLIAGVVIARSNPSDIALPVSFVIAATIMLVTGTTIEQKKMKPLRDEWVRDIDAKVKAASKAKKRTK